MATIIQSIMTCRAENLPKSLAPKCTMFIMYIVLRSDASPCVASTQVLVLTAQACRIHVSKVRRKSLCRCAASPGDVARKLIKELDWSSDASPCVAASQVLVMLGHSYVHMYNRQLDNQAATLSMYSFALRFARFFHILERRSRAVSWLSLEK